MASQTSNGSRTAANDIVVSLDFGTSHSGYAFGKAGLTNELGKPGNASRIASFIYVRDNWPGARTRYPKTLSATLYDYDSRPIAFGDKALDEYLALRGNKIQEHALIRRVKLLLADDIHYHDPQLINTGLEPSAVIGDFLGFLKRDIEEHLVSAGFKDDKQHPITWVMTTPTSWSDKARDSMMKAASSGGLCDNGGKVVFCLEPEAAILSTAVTTNHIHHDDCVLVVDMGGGTVDWVTMQVRQGAPGLTWHGLDFQEILCSEGRTCGATIFDDAFHSFFLELIGVPKRDSDGTNSNMSSRLFVQWEDIKRMFDGRADWTRWIQLDVELHSRMPQGKAAELTRQNRYDPDRLEVSIFGKDIIKCFDTVYSTIAKVTEQMLNRAKRVNKPINKLLCVGGFSEMAYMKRCIHDSFASQGLDIIFPLNAGGSVVQGALLFGIKADSVTLQPANSGTMASSPSTSTFVSNHTGLLLSNNSANDSLLKPDQEKHLVTVGTAPSSSHTIDMADFQNPQPNQHGMSTADTSQSKLRKLLHRRSSKCCCCVVVQPGVVIILWIFLALAGCNFWEIHNSKIFEQMVGIFMVRVYQVFLSISTLHILVMLALVIGKTRTHLIRQANQSTCVLLSITILLLFFIFGTGANWNPEQVAAMFAMIILPLACLTWELYRCAAQLQA